MPLESLLGAFTRNISRQWGPQLSRARRSAAAAVLLLIYFTTFCTPCSHEWFGGTKLLPEVYLAKYLVTDKDQLWWLREERKKRTVVLCLTGAGTSGNRCGQGCVVLFNQADPWEIYFWILLSAFLWYRKCICIYKSLPAWHLVLNSDLCSCKNKSQIFTGSLLGPSR